MTPPEMVLQGPADVHGSFQVSVASSEVVQASPRPEDFVVTGGSVSSVETPQEALTPVADGQGGARFVATVLPDGAPNVTVQVRAASQGTLLVLLK